MNVANFSLPDDRTDRWRVKLRGDAVRPEGALFIPISYCVFVLLTLLNSNAIRILQKLLKGLMHNGSWVRPYPLGTAVITRAVFLAGLFLVMDSYATRNGFF